MREILFRGKRIDNGEWVEGLPFGSIYGGFSNGAICAIRQTVEKYGDIHEVVIETVGQYTGLTDKKGKRIFEGDIINVVTEEGFNFGGQYLVEWDNESCSFVLKNTEGVRYSFDMISGMQRWVKCQIEIIGNKFDNPELLEDEE